MNAPANFFEFNPEQQVLRLTESNRQLREELEKVKGRERAYTNDESLERTDVTCERCGDWWAPLIIRGPLRICDDCAQRKVTTLTTALAAAKEALENARPRLVELMNYYERNEKHTLHSFLTRDFHEAKDRIDSALARIAECEKARNE